MRFSFGIGITLLVGAMVYPSLPKTAAGLTINRDRILVRCPIDPGSDREIYLLNDFVELVSIDRRDGSGLFLMPERDWAKYHREFPESRIELTSDQIKATRIDSDYLEPQEVETALAAYASTYPDICALHSIGVSFEGRTIWAVKISDAVGIHEDEPEFLFMGAIHGRDVMSTEVPMDIIDYLCSNYGIDPQVRTWVNSSQIWVIPMLNVDGSAYCWMVDPWWVKNRRDNGDGTYGVNLNRNFPFLWGDCLGSSGNTSSSVYRGPSPGSEPEVQAIIDLATQHRFMAAISYHAFNEMVLYPYGCRDLYSPDHEAMQSIGRRIAQAIIGDDGVETYDYGTWWEKTATLDGAETDWLYGAAGTLCYAVQLNASSYSPSYSSFRDLTVQRNRPGWQLVLNLMTDTRMIYGHLTDACTGQPATAAAYQVEEIPLVTGESLRTTDPIFGRFFYFLMRGEYHLKFEKQGYGAAFEPCRIVSDPVEKNFSMVPTTGTGLAALEYAIEDSSGDNDGILDPGEIASLEVRAYAPGLGLTGVTAVIETSSSYLSILQDSAAFPDFGAGATGWTESPHFMVTADPDTPDDRYPTVTINFSADQALCLTSDTFIVPIRSYYEMCPYVEFTLDQNPGWTIQNSDSQGWAFGYPYYGPGSPHSGANVYGTNLFGNYSDNCDYRLTSTAIDCSSLAETTLRFWRFLNNEEDSDVASVLVSNNGTTWQTVFSGEVQDYQWVERSYDISAVADGQPSVYVRFRLTSNYDLNFPGFYIDDIAICGNYQGAPPATYIPTATPIPIPTDTPTFTPSNTPVATATVTPTPTVTVTTTPTDLPSQSPTPTATATEVNSETPTAQPTEPPSATPIPFVVRLNLNADRYHAGDPFVLICSLENNGPDITVDRYIVLDVYGSYWFHPSWDQLPDHSVVMLDAGESRHNEILSFLWPEGAGQASGILFWAGCIHSGTTQLMGEICSVSFGWE